MKFLMHELMMLHTTVDVPEDFVRQGDWTNHTDYDDEDEFLLYHLLRNDNYLILPTYNYWRKWRSKEM